jgi:DNA polymerase I-like protein with 3'-5' exonuclease and polymerase domains/uracil-DNA glycosylase
MTTSPRPRVSGHGPDTASIMLVGEAPGSEEERLGQPFVGASGQELRRMCSEAGIPFDSTFRTNVARFRPRDNQIKNFFATKSAGRKAGLTELYGRFCRPEIVQGLQELIREITLIKPALIIALGDTALWALTGGKSGIGKWRGSQLQTFEPAGYKLLPTYHPAGVLRQWSWRTVVVHDLRRALAYLQDKAPPPNYHFRIRPTFEQAAATLCFLRTHALPISVDIETRGGAMSCVGLAWSPTQAICLPFIHADGRRYWTPEHEKEIRTWLRTLLTMTLPALIMQNGIYDCQYFIREDGYCPHVTDDTMLAQHAMMPGTPKGLDYLSSLYCDYHVYWKDEGKEWNPSLPEEQHWTYNCKDVCATYDVWHSQKSALESLNKASQYQFLMDLYKPVLTMMTTGVALDQRTVLAEAQSLQADIARANSRLELLFGHAINPRSPAQLQRLFYHDFALPQIRQRKTGRATLDEAALTELKTKHPIFSRAIDLILECRQLGVLLSNFILAQPSPDFRFHTSFNIGGTETFRFSSSANGFGEGTNGQNIAPRLRRLLVPDPGHELQDWDLAQADARVVAWDANCARLKEIFSNSARSIHVENTRALFSAQVAGWSDEAIKDSQVSDTHYARYYFLAKTGVHAVNYMVQARTLARTLGLTTREAEKFIQTWLGLNPEIKAWHEATELSLQTTRTVSNVFGFHRIYFDRIDMSVVQAALAWIGQSTVAIAISQGLLNLYNSPVIDDLDLLLQVHDSILLQLPIDKLYELTPKIKQELLVEIPYSDPLVIPVGVKRSQENWGSVK